MKSKTVVLLSGITLLAFLSVPIRPATQEEGERASKPDTGANPVPLINQPLVPGAVVPGGPELALTVNGSGFVSGSIVEWNDKPLPTKFVNGSQLKAKVPPRYIAKPGTALVTVVSPSPGGGTSNVDLFDITTPSTSVSFKISTQGPGESNLITDADLNADGKLDLVGLNQNSISVRLGNGNGTFGSEADYAVADGAAVSPVVGDFNGDGRPDVAVACYGVISILLGNGDGTFEPYTTAPIDAFAITGGTANGMATGDLNGDGKLDFVVGYQAVASNAVTVLLGNGDGTFQPAVDYPTGNEPNAIAIADLNRDGRLDIVAGNFGEFGGHTVSVLLGDGDGTFQPQVQYETAQGDLSIVVADFNGDGKPDLAVDCPCGNGTACGSIGVISVLLGRGDGTFRKRTDYVVEPEDAFPYTVSSGDYNGDGTLDLLVTDLNTEQVALLPGNGDGSFGTSVLYGSTGNSPVGIASGDFTGHGRLDAVIGTGTGFTTLLQTNPQ